MQRSIRLVCAMLAIGCLLAVPVFAADLTSGMKAGKPDIKSAGALTFGPDGILFVGDTQGGSIFAIDTGEKVSSGTISEFKVDEIDAKIAARLGTTPDQILINDLAVNPASGRAYLSISRGKGPDALPVLLTVDAKGNLADVADKEVKFSKVSLSNVPAERGRQDSITDLAYSNGRLFVAGLSNEEFASKLRVIPFPFQTADAGTSVEIYHGAHGKFETNAPVRTFALHNVGGQETVLAAYTCTPLVKFPVADLKPGAKVKGHTVAELGNRNKPLDMVVYQKDGKYFILMANSARGVMKVSTDNIDKAEAIEAKVEKTAGLPYETLADWKGVQHLDRLGGDRALLLVKADGGPTRLEAAPLP